MMRESNGSSAGSGWGWGHDAQAVPLPPRPPAPRKRGGGELVLAVVVFLGILGAIAAAVVLGTGGDDETAEAETSEETSAVAEPEEADAEPEGAAPRSLKTIVWTTEAPATLDELARAWSIPKDTLAASNPKLSPDETLAAGTKVVVYRHTQGPSASIGPPNDGKLSGAMPLPEGKAWLMPEDRSRAFATTETIAAVVTALEAYGRQFPGAAPIQVGDLSARRGGSIYGHQSHQSGRDVDIRLILADDGEGFDAAKNWYLVKTLVDGGAVREIFLNRSEQPWLRAAAEADVGVADATRYFELIEHEPGHTIHMHVRFDCPSADKRCVGYSMPGSDEGEADPVRKLPLSPGGSKASGGTSKLPGGSKSGGTTTTKKAKKKLTKTKKKR